MLRGEYERRTSHKVVDSMLPRKALRRDYRQIVPKPTQVDRKRIPRHLGELRLRNSAK